MKQIQHTINGQELTLDVGKMYFSKYFGEATKADPIIDISELLTNTVKQFDFVVGLVYGGVNCFNKTNGKEFVKLETVQQWVGAMEDGEAALLIDKYVKAITPDEPGEGQPQVTSP